MKAAVTGASGFIGGYLVNELIKQGHQVAALCRSESVLAHLRGKGVNVAVGNLLDLDSLRKFCRGQDCVFHGAAIVSGFAPWSQFYNTGVVGTENIINAAVEAGVVRFIHLSSMTVYGTCPNLLPIKESTSIDQHVKSWNHYARQKILSEKLVWGAHHNRQILATIFRPSLVLGPGDHNVVARTLRYIKSPFGAIIGQGNNYVACVVVDELARAIVKSATLQVAIGKAYNLSGANPITQADYLNFHSLAAGLPQIRRKIPVKLAQVSCAVLENLYKLVGSSDEPFCTRIALDLVSEHLEVDCSLATRDLNWTGSGDYERAIRLSVEWYLKNQNQFESYNGN